MGFWTAIRTEVLRMLRRPGYLIALLLCPVVILAGRGLLPEEARQAEVVAGICFAGEDETSRALREGLEARSGGLVTFCPATGTEAERKVASGEWECAFLFPADLEERMEEQDWEGLITLLTADDSLLARPVAEQVSAALLEQGWDEVAEGYLRAIGLEEEITAPLEEVLPEEDWVAIRIRSVGASAAAEEAEGSLPYRELLWGVVGLWLFMAALLAGGELCARKKHPYTRYAQPVTGLWGWLLPEWTVLSLAALVTGALSLLLAGAPMRALAGLAGYLPVLALLSLLLALLPGAERVLPVLLPVIPLVSLVLSPLLVDVSRMVPELTGLSRCLPLTGYLLFLRGEGPGLLLAQGGAGALVTGILILLRKWKEKERQSGLD